MAEVSNTVLKILNYSFIFSMIECRLESFQLSSDTELAFLDIKFCVWLAYTCVCFWNWAYLRDFALSIQYSVLTMITVVNEKVSWKTFSFF